MSIPSVTIGIVRALLPLLLTSCTLGGTAPALRVPARPDPDQMSSATLDKQDPGADTSKNQELSRSEWSGSRSEAMEAMGHVVGCLGWFPRCQSGRGDASGLLLVGALAFVLRRRRR